MAGKGGCPLLMDRNHESKTKKVDGEAHPASDFAYVPDPEKPSTWKLPIFNMRHVGGALAAMTSDHRGNPVEIPEGDRRAVMKKNPGQESETGTGRKLIPFSFISFFPPVNRKERNIFSLRSPVLAVWGRADTIQIPAFCGAFGWHPRRNERHSHPSDAPGGYSRIFHLRTASKTVVKQKKKLNYSKIINHPKDVFPLKWIGEIQEI